MDKNSKVALALPDQSLMHMCQVALVGNHKLNAIVQFSSVDEAYEVMSRQHFDFIVVGIHMPDNPGITLMQRLREVGNYGMEPFLFLGDKVDDSMRQIFLEYDVEYVLTAPIDKKRVANGISQIFQREAKLPETVQMYRDAKSAMITGVYEMAQDFATQLLQDAKLKEKAKIMLGEIAFHQGNSPEAQRLFEEVIAENPDSIAAIHKLAMICMKQTHFERAKSLLDAIVNKNPLHLKVLEEAGLTNFELGHVDLAKEQMGKLNKFDKTNQAATEVQTKISIQEGNFDGIAQRLKDSHSEKEIVSMLNTAGVMLSKKSDFAGAIKIYENCLEVVRKKEFKGKISYNLAIAYRKSGDLKQAKVYCERSLKFIPDFAKAQTMLTELKSAA